MNSGRAITIELSSTEVSILTEVMCARGCSIEDALRVLIMKHGPGRRANNNYMRDYMNDYRAAKKLGLEVMEYRQRKPK
jgi:hypothetical protein